MVDGFIFYRSFGDALRGVPADEYKQIMQAIIDYALDGVEPELDSFTGNIIFTLIRPQIDANGKRREAGKRGGRPKKTTDSDEKTNGLENENHRLSDEKPKEKDKEKVKVKDKEKDKDKGKEIGTEPDKSAPSVITLTLNDGSAFPITQEMVDKWRSLYQSVDIMQELRKMSGWLDANPTRRKTRTGVLRFIAAWLSKEQDKGGQRGAQRPTAPKQTRFHNFEEREDDDLDALMAQKMRERLNA